jgi:hypothetical protein
MIKGCIVYFGSPSCFLFYNNSPPYKCVFPSLVNDMHTVGPTSNVVPVFLQLQ